MRNFRRRLSTGVRVLSLILCLATVGLWVRSYWFTHEICWLDGARTSYHVNAWSGRAFLYFQYSAYYPARPSGFAYARSPRASSAHEINADHPFLGRAGFEYENRDRAGFGGKAPSGDWRAPRWFRWFGLPTD